MAYVTNPKIKPHLVLRVCGNGQALLELVEAYESYDKAKAAIDAHLATNTGEIVCYAKVETAFKASVTVNHLKVNYGGTLMPMEQSKEDPSSLG